MSTDTEWMTHGACVGTNPDVFFVERGESTGAARNLCRQCPVVGECLEFAIANGEQFGIWGDTTERERRAIRRARRGGNVAPTRVDRPLRPCGTEAAYRRHTKRGEPPCDACREAKRAGRRKSDAA